MYAVVCRVLACADAFLVWCTIGSVNVDHSFDNG